MPEQAIPEQSIPKQSNPKQETTRRCAGRTTVLLLSVAALWCLYWFVHAWGYWEDDAYIHLEFARSVAAGKGFAFNGHVVAGDTAPLWVFLLAGMHTLIPNWLVAGKTLTVLGAGFGLSGAYAYARRLAGTMIPSSYVAEIFPAAVVLLIVANPYTSYWIFSGMEPLAASGLAFWAMLAATRARPTTASLLSASLLAGLAPLLRPEMIFFTALLALPLLGQWCRLTDAAGTRAKLGTLVAGLLLIAGPVVLWSLYSLHAFGHLLPNTNAAKRAGPDNSVVYHLISIYSAGLPLIVFGVVAGGGYLLLRFGGVWHSLRSAIDAAFTRSATAKSGFPLSGWIFILWPTIATFFYIANHTYVQTRYVLVTAPALTIVILLAVFTRSRRGGCVLYAVALIAALVVSGVIVRPFVRNKAINCAATHDLALYLRDRLPPNAPVAVYAIGEIAFVSQHPIIDTGGITRPGAIPYIGAPIESMLRWARSEGAQYFIGFQPEPDAVHIYSVDERFGTWTTQPSLFSTSQPMELWKLAPRPVR